MMSRHKETTPICHCGTKTILKTSWTDRNPARRYLECVGDEVHGCGFWEWYDDEICARSKQVILGLLRKTNRLEVENEALREDVQRWQNKAEKMEVQVRKLKEQLGRKQRKNLFIVVSIAVWAIMTIWKWTEGPRNGHHFGKFQING